MFSGCLVVWFIPSFEIRFYSKEAAARGGATRRITFSALLFFLFFGGRRPPLFFVVAFFNPLLDYQIPLPLPTLKQQPRTAIPGGPMTSLLIQWTAQGPC